MNCLWCPDCLGDVATLFRTHASQAMHALAPPTALCFTLWCLPRCALLPHVANVCLVSWLHIRAVHLVMWTFDMSSCGGIQSTTYLACSLFKQWSPAPLASSAVLSSAALCCGRGLSTTPMSSILHTWCCCVAVHVPRLLWQTPVHNHVSSSRPEFVRLPHPCASSSDVLSSPATLLR